MEIQTPTSTLILNALYQGKDIPIGDKILKLDQNKNLCVIGSDKILTPLDWTVGQFIRYCNSLSVEQFGIICATLALRRW